MLKIMENIGECEEAKSGDDAIALFQKAIKEHRPFDLMTLDIGMPVKDGTETLFEIREYEQKNNGPKNLLLKILMVTAHSDKDTIITSVQAGCDGYIVKPFDRDTVIEKMINVGFTDRGSKWGRVILKN